MFVLLFLSNIYMRGEVATAVHYQDAQAFSFRKEGLIGLVVRRVKLTVLGYGSFQNLAMPLP